jgi:adenylate cyclase
MVYRIGINIGDVIEEGERIYGDGVNIAARIEALAEAGGICVSRNVYDQVKNRLSLEYEYLGEHTVKNISEPIRVYRVVMQTKAVLKESIEAKLPDKPSIAVLPFVNMSGDPEQEYFSDGLTEDLITDLSKISGLFVIARNSSFTYKGKAVKAQEVSQEPGVRFFVEGSVRKASNRIRISAQLVDAITGGHLWAERYDRELKDIFDLQDEVTQKIVAALAVNLTTGEKNRLACRGTDNLKAYDYALRGLGNYYRYTKEANAQAQEMFKKASDLDPEYALAYSWLGLALLHSWTQGWNPDSQTVEKAFGLAQKAITLDDSLPEPHRIMGDVYLYKKQHELAIAEREKAISLEPNNADALASLGEALAWAGSLDNGIEMIERAMRLNPHHHVWYFFVLGTAYILAERYKKALELMERALIRDPNFFGTHLLLAGLHGQKGDTEKARAEVEEILRISPGFSLETLREMMPAKDEATRERLMDALRKAGLPE